MQDLSGYSAIIGLFSSGVMISIIGSLVYVGGIITVVDVNSGRAEARKYIKQLVIVHQLILGGLLAMAIFVCLTAPSLVDPSMNWIVVLVTPTPEPVRLSLLLVGAVGALIVNYKLMKGLTKRISVLASTTYNSGK